MYRGIPPSYCVDPKIADVREKIQAKDAQEKVLSKKGLKCARFNVRVK